MVNADDCCFKGDLSLYFHLPLQQAANEMNIGTTNLKKLCREKGIKRWPYRKIKSIEELIDDLQKCTGNCDFKVDVETLKRKRKYLLENPDVPYREVIPKYLTNCLKIQISKYKLGEHEQKIEAKDSFSISSIKSHSLEDSLSTMQIDDKRESEDLHSCNLTDSFNSLLTDLKVDISYTRIKF